MQYALLIYCNGSAEASAKDIDRVTSEYWAYEKAVADAGVKRGGEALQPTSTATVVRVRDGERLVTDGPFAETREQLGGFYLIECDDLDQALAWAEKCPGAQYGAIEVRPVMVFDAPTG
jgi:hypothetical protein